MIKYMTPLTLEPVEDLLQFNCTSKYAGTLVSFFYLGYNLSVLLQPNQITLKQTNILVIYKVYNLNDTQVNIYIIAK